MSEEKTFKKELSDIARLMRAYAHDCENDTCKDCRFGHFCLNGYPPSKIVNTLKDVIEFKFVEAAGGKKMTDKQALEILEEWIEADHKIIGNNPQSDFDKFIAEKCEAVEIAIEALKERMKKGGQ